MSLLEITVQPDISVSHYTVTLTLDGDRYHFDFYTNAASDGWAMDVSNDDGSAIVRGIAITAGTDLLYPYRHLDLPPGALFVRDKGLNGGDPDLGAFLDGRAALYYLEAG